jgi:hypothetical protein
MPISETTRRTFLGTATVTAASYQRILDANDRIAIGFVGFGLIAMKVLGEGQLRNRVDDALRYAATNDVVPCFTLGCESRAEFKDNFQRISRVSQPA